MLSYQPLSANAVSEPVRIDVHVGLRASTIWIGDGIIDRAGALLDAQNVGPASASSYRARSSGDCTASGSPARSAAADPILVPDGERFKNLQSVSRIYDALVRAAVPIAAARSWRWAVE